MIISFLPVVATIFVSRGKLLCNSALVCRRWLPASRHHLFMHVRITSNPQYNLFISKTVRSQHGRSWLSSTRLFYLYGGRFDKQSDGPDKHMATRLFIHELGGQLPNLEKLDLEELDFDVMEASSSPRKFAALSAFASVRNLRLRHCRFPSFAALRHALASLPSLTDLHLDDIGWPIASSPGSPDPLFPFLRGLRKSPFLARVRCLEFWVQDGSFDDYILQWLSTTSLAVSLSDITVRPAALMRAQGFWEYVGPSTTRLRVWPVEERELLNDCT